MGEPPGRVGALVLAAGVSRRFGGSKLLANFRGRSLVSHVLDAVSAARARGLLAGTHVVVAEGDGQVAELAQKVGAVLLTNPQPARGLSSSLKLGLAALPRDLDAVLVFLADQPLVRPEVIESLIEAWRNGAAVVVRPRYAMTPGAPGHPVLLARSIWALADGLEGDSGFGGRFSPGAADVLVLDVPGGNPDVDTPADLLTLKDSRG